AGRPRKVARRERDRDQAAAGTPARRGRAADLRPHRPPAHDPPSRDRGVERMRAIDNDRRWRDVLADAGVDEPTAERLIVQLRACEAAALAFCRLLERWARGEPDPCTPGRRQAALRRAADRAETAIAGLEQPLDRFLLELEPETAEGRSWYGE